MRQSRVFAQICIGLLLVMSLPAMAQDKFVLVTNPSKVQDVCGRHGLAQVTQLSKHGVFLVTTSSQDPGTAAAPEVQSFEQDHALTVPELSGATIANLTQSSTAILDGLPGRNAVKYFGSSRCRNHLV